MIGEIYEANREYEQSLRVMKYAYRRSSSSKMVLYRLAELDIRLGNYDEAKKFINEFEQISPNDTSRYILKYKLLKAEKAPLDDQIEVLRSYRDTEYTERWAYELAKLYLRNGQKEKCIEECVQMAMRMQEKDPRVFVPQQFVNPHNTETHLKHTAREILDQAGKPIHGFCSVLI